MSTQIGESLLYRVGALAPSVFYRDPEAAMLWLEKAFGFERALTVTGDDGALEHIEMAAGDGALTIAGLWGDFSRSPLDVGGGNTQFLKLVLNGDLDAHFQRAVAAGARIAQSPGDQAYRQRTYRVFDPEGHLWTFATNLDGN
jgi:uncharacterized glyoxalase superfamily protein PhnB